MTSITCQHCQAVTRFLRWLLWWTYVSVWIDVTVSGLRVKFGVLLPEQPVCPTMHPCTTLSLAKAEEWLIAENLLQLNWIVDSSTSSKSLTRDSKTSSIGISVQFDYSNSQCSDMYGPVRAMEIYYGTAGCQDEENSGLGSVLSPDVRVFYGPCCKYTLAPVGRYAKVWDVPVITPGGLTFRFSDSSEFIMLTRFIPPYEKVAKFVLSLLAKFNWWHISFLFHDNLGPDLVKGYPMCYDIMDAVFKRIESRAKRTSQTTAERSNGTTSSYHDNCCVLHREIFNENYYDDFDFDTIMDLIRNASRGEYLRKQCSIA